MDPVIYFLSDYGTADEFVGIVRAVLTRMAPGVPIIDLCHEVAPFDVDGGAEMLLRCAPSLGPGVVLAVVDPGVGTGRRGVAIEVGVDQPARKGERREAVHPRWLVGPDNGLLLPVAEALGGATSVVELDRPFDPSTAARGAVRAETGSVATGPTFDGRDLFAPAVAHLVAGGDPRRLGPAAPSSSLVGATRGPERSSAVGGTVSPGGGRVAPVRTDVAWIDRFGNVQLRATPADLVAAGLDARTGRHLRVVVETGAGSRIEAGAGSGPPEGDPRIEARRVTAFGELEEGELGLLVDSNGRLALVMDRSSAAERLGMSARGGRVELEGTMPTAPPSDRNSSST